jgi:hypothetical protein
MSYDIGGGYDGWKLSTPWDDEVSTTVCFDCVECEEPNDNIDVVVGRRDDYVDVECEECGKVNTVDIGGDW